MQESFFETELRFALRASFASNRIRDIGAAKKYFQQIEQNYPIAGSKIDWKRVPGFIEQSDNYQTPVVDQCAAFFDYAVLDFGLTGEVVYIGDNAIEFALSGKIDCLREVLPELLTVPQHHFFIGSEFSWCMSFSMEGDMAFGFRPSHAGGRRE